MQELWFTEWGFVFNELAEDHHAESIIKNFNNKMKYLQRVPRLALEGQHVIHHVSVSSFDAIAGKGWLLASSKTHSYENTRHTLISHVE